MDPMAAMSPGREGAAAIGSAVRPRLVTAVMSACALKRYFTTLVRFHSAAMIRGVQLSRAALTHARSRMKNATAPKSPHAATFQSEGARESAKERWSRGLALGLGRWRSSAGTCRSGERAVRDAPLPGAEAAARCGRS